MLPWHGGAQVSQLWRRLPCGVAHWLIAVHVAMLARDLACFMQKQYCVHSMLDQLGGTCCVEAYMDKVDGRWAMPGLFMGMSLYV